MSQVKARAEIEILKQGGSILAAVLQAVAAVVRAGVSTAELNARAEAGLRKRGATPSFLGYGDTKNPYPASLCTSVNAGVVHGIPSQSTLLREGDIVGLDLGCWYQGLCTDMALTVAVGSVSSVASKLIKVTRAALTEGLKQVHAGGHVGDISHAIQTYVEASGFSVVRALTGHGVGHAVHEAPPVPNFGSAGAGPLLEPGMVLAIEPMVNAGGYAVEWLLDGWGVVTADGSLSAHFEHTVVVTEKGYEVLTQV